MRRYLKLALGVGISVVLLYVVFQGVDRDQFFSHLKQAKYGWLVPAIGIYLVGVWFRAVRWRFLLNPVKRLGSADLFGPIAVGYFANNVLPFRAGEFYRAYVIGRKAAISKSAAFATIVVERVFDGLTMLILLALSVPLLVRSFTISSVQDQERVEVVIAVSVIVFGGLFLGGLLVIRQRVLARRLLDLGARRLPQKVGQAIVRLGDSFLDGLEVLRRGEDLLWTQCYSLLAWLCEATFYYLIFFCFDLRLSFLVAVLLVAIVNLGIMIPSSPGYVGPFEFFAKMVLLCFGLGEEVSMSYIVLLHVALWLPITLIGFVYAWKEHLSLRGVKAEFGGGGGDGGS